MLEVCNEGLSLAAQRSQFAIWSIMTSPLILGNVSHHRPLSSIYWHPARASTYPLGLTVWLHGRIRAT